MNHFHAQLFQVVAVLSTSDHMNHKHIGMIVDIFWGIRSEKDQTNKFN